MKIAHITSISSSLIILACNAPLEIETAQRQNSSGSVHSERPEENTEPNSNDTSKTGEDPSDAPSESTETPESLIEFSFESIQIRNARLEVVPPAGLRLSLNVLDGNGNPVPPINPDDIVIINDETGMPISDGLEGGAEPTIGKPHSIGIYSVLALDFSNSITSSDSVDPMIDGALAYLDQLQSMDQSLLDNYYISLMVFGATIHNQQVLDFTSNLDTVRAKLESLRNQESLGSTDLYGAYKLGLDLLAARQGSFEVEERTMVLFTDGSHEAGDTTNQRAEALAKKSSVPAHIYTVALDGHYDPEAVRELASSENHFYQVLDTEGIALSFRKIAAWVDSVAHSHYVVGICTPVSLGTPSITVQITARDSNANTALDKVSLGYDITSLTGEINRCDPASIAQGQISCDGEGCQTQCVAMECGCDQNVLCGSCGEGYGCSEESLCVPGGEVINSCTAPGSGSSVDPGTHPPQIVSAELISPNEINVYFNEPLASIWTEDLSLDQFRIAVSEYLPGQDITRYADPYVYQSDGGDNVYAADEYNDANIEADAQGGYITVGQYGWHAAEAEGKRLTIVLHNPITGEMCDEINKGKTMPGVQNSGLRLHYFPDYNNAVHNIRDLDGMVMQGLGEDFPYSNGGSYNAMGQSAGYFPTLDPSFSLDCPGGDAPQNVGPELVSANLVPGNPSLVRVVFSEALDNPDIPMVTGEQFRIAISEYSDQNDMTSYVDPYLFRSDGDENGYAADLEHDENYLDTNLAFAGENDYGSGSGGIGEVGGVNSGETRVVDIDWNANAPAQLLLYLSNPITAENCNAIDSRTSNAMGFHDTGLRVHYFAKSYDASARLSDPDDNLLPFFGEDFRYERNGVYNAQQSVPGYFPTLDPSIVIACELD